MSQQRVTEERIEAGDPLRMPYQLPFPLEAQREIVLPSPLPADERVWVPQMENVWFRPLCLNASQGYWVNLLRVRKAGVLTRHRHPAPVHGFVLRGAWHYLEHDWTAVEGSYVFEPPGETHTLVVPNHVPEMITLFHITACMIYVDPWGKQTGYEDVFTKIKLCRQHYDKNGLGLCAGRRVGHDVGRLHGRARHPNHERVPSGHHRWHRCHPG